MSAWIAPSNAALGAVNAECIVVLPHFVWRPAGGLPQGRGRLGGAGAARAWAPDPFSGADLRLPARRADRVNLVYFDGTGCCLLSKRLEDGKFCWPAVTDGVCG